MFSLLLRCEPHDEERLTADIWEQDTAGVAEEPGGLRAFFDDNERAPELLIRFERFSPELRMEAQTDWAQVSRDAWPPMLAGERFFLVPPWCRDPAPQGRLRLEIYPGMACGTGRHPATQLCLEALERTVRPGKTVVDVGTGSGILSAGALLLGASVVIACDVDPDAIAIARARVDVPFFVGSIDAIRSGAADVIVANINSETIERLRPEFERVGSVLILSGFQKGDEPSGFEVAETLEHEEWICLIVTPRELVE